MAATSPCVGGRSFLTTTENRMLPDSGSFLYSETRAASSSWKNTHPILLAARCDPNALGESRQSPLLYAIGIQDKEAVEDLLMARADVDCAPTGLEPPLCVAVRHRMGDIAKVLLSYHADVEARSQPAGPDSESGPTATELAAEDPALAQLFRAHFRWRTGLLDIEEAD